MEKKQLLIQGKILSYYQGWNTEKQWVLVFLHGWMQNGTSFKDIFENLEKKNVPYISFDLPGFGSSGLLHNTMTIDDYANHIVAGVEKLWLKNSVLIWHSFWGKTILNIQKKYTNIDKIVLICSAGVRKMMPEYKKIIIKTGKILLSLPGFRIIWERVKSGLSSPDYKNAGKMEDIFRNAIAQDYTPQMKSIRKPCLLIWWESDDQTPLSDGKYMNENIQNSELKVLKWSHFVHQEKAREITNMILDFIRK